MALTKSHLIDAITQQNGFTRKKSSETVETILEINKSTLAFGDDVMISRFGKFCVQDKRERRGRNPATGEDTADPQLVFRLVFAIAWILMQSSGINIQWN